MFNRNAIEARQADRDSLARAMAEYERSTPVQTEPIRQSCYNRVSCWDSSTSSKEARRKRASAPLRAKAEDARRKKGTK